MVSLPKKKGEQLNNIDARGKEGNEITLLLD
jgi:hypothetical protein